jgi:hypothetical protein
MRTFYSLLQVPLRPAGQEQLNIGLLLVGDHGILFSYSEPKLNALKNLIPSTAFNLLRSYLISLKTKINEDSSLIKTQFSNLEFLNYLSNYNNNLLTFSKPSALDIEPTKETFKRLFEKFVFEPSLEVELSVLAEPLPIYSQVQTKLFPKIEGKVNIDKKVTSHDLKTLIAPVKVDFIGKNQVPVAGVSVDFTKSENTLVNSLSKFVSLIHALDKDNLQGGKYFVLGKEPNQNSIQHKRWEDMRDTGFVEFIDIDEIETVASYIDEHHVKPLFPKER